MQQRTTMFAQTPPVTTLADILQSPADFDWSGTDGNLRTSVKLFFKNKRYNSSIICTISDINDFNIPEFNLYYLVNLDHLYPDLSCTAIQTFMSCFFFKLEQLPLQTQERYLQQFFGNTTYIQLHGVNPYLARRFMRFLLDNRETLSSDTVPNFRGMAKAPAVLLQFADYLADCQTKFPRELLENGKITESIASCDYKNIPQSVRSKMRVEGSFGLKPADKNVYEMAKKKIQNAPNGQLTSADLKELRKAVFERNILDHQLDRYPVPEQMPWQGQKELLDGLRILEGMMQYRTDENRVFLRLRITDEELINKLLITNVRSTSYIGHYVDMEKLPLGLFNGISRNEYFVTMPSGRTFAWTESLSKYIEKYNVLPSKEFFILFDNLVSDCRKHYLPAAGNLALYLHEHPLVLEKDNVRPVMSQRM